MGMSAYLAEQLATAWFNAGAWVWPSTWYIGLFTTQPVSGAGGTETTYTGYARLSTTHADWNAASGGIVTNSAVKTFANNTGGAGVTIVGFGFWDALTAGNMLLDQLLTVSQVINAGGNGAFAASSLSYTFKIAP